MYEFYKVLLVKTEGNMKAILIPVELTTKIDFNKIYLKALDILEKEIDKEERITEDDFKYLFNYSVARAVLELYVEEGVRFIDLEIIEQEVYLRNCIFWSNGFLDFEPEFVMDKLNNNKDFKLKFELICKKSKEKMTKRSRKFTFEDFKRLIKEYIGVDIDKLR